MAIRTALATPSSAVVVVSIVYASIAMSCVAESVTIVDRDDPEGRSEPRGIDVTENQRERGDAGEAARDPEAAGAEAGPVDQRGPEELEAPRRRDGGDVADVRQRGALGAEVDRKRFVDETERKAGRKGQRADPGEPSPERPLHRVAAA